MSFAIPNQMYIDGAWTDASDGARLEVIDPATEEVIDRVPVATTADLDRALGAATRGFELWRATDAWTRSATLRKVAEWIRSRVEPLAAVMTAEQGKPLPEAARELKATADQFDWFADEARRIYGRTVDAHSTAHRIWVNREPIGPVAAFTPWNFPALLAARKIAAALAAGCSIVLKPAEETPRTAFAGLALACHECGIPPGVVNVVTGDPSAISAHLIDSDAIRKVSFTGSVPVGKLLAHQCAERIKPITLELGGHAPVLVFEDADVEAAAEIAARAKFRNNGQVCIAASRFFVQAAVADRFTDRFVQAAESLRVGDGRTPGVDVGPLANARRREATESLVSDAVDKGAELRTGGRRPDDLERGFFYCPTVVTGVNDDMRLWTEEPFCPVAPIAPFTDLDDVIPRANATPYGLAAYVFTRDTRTTMLAAERLEVGMVGVNSMVIAAAEAPFGGVKQSGYGREGGAEGIDSYLVTKYVNVLLQP